MRPVNRNKVWAVLFAGAFAILAFSGVTGQGEASDPEDEFFGGPEEYELAPGMPMGDLPMMGGMGPGGPGGPPCAMPGGPGMMGGPGQGPGPGGPGMPCACMGMRGGPGMHGPMGGMMGGPGFGPPEERMRGMMMRMMHGGPPGPHSPMGPGGPMPDGRGPEHRFSVFHLLTHPVHHAEEFGLTDGEKKALVGLREKLLYPTIEKEKALEATRFALRDTLGNPDFDAGKARDLAKKIGALESELRDLAIGAAVEVRKLLGAERYAKLTHGEDEHKPRMLQMMMRHGGPPPGPGHPEGPPPGAPRPEQPPPRH